jgi:carbonyl reductase 1
MGFNTASDTQIRYPALDIADLGSIRNLAEAIHQDHGAIDVLINNAGVNLDNNYTPENVKATLDANVRGTRHMSF